MSKEEKFFLKGQYAKQCLKWFMPNSYFEFLKQNPMKEIRDISIIRNILDDPKFSFKPAFDLSIKEIHFYCLKEDLAEEWTIYEDIDLKQFFDD